MRPASSGTTQRQPTVRVTNTSVVQTGRCTSADLSRSLDVEGATQGVTRSCMCETLEGAPLTDLHASQRLSLLGQMSRNTDLLSMELTCCLHNSTCSGNNTTAVDSMQKDAANIGTQLQGDSPAPHSSESTSSKSVTPSETNCSSHNAVGVHSLLERSSSATTPHSSSHCLSKEQSGQQQKLQDNSSTILQSKNVSVGSSDVGPSSVDAGEQLTEEEEEEESENMEVSEVMRTMLGDIRTADNEVDIIPLEAKPPLSPVREVEWPSMEDVWSKRIGHSNEAGADLVSSKAVQSCAVILSSQGTPAEPCGGSTNDCASVASVISDDCYFRPSQLHHHKGALSNDASTNELSLSKSPTECLLESCNFELDEVADLAEGATGDCDLLPRSSTPLIGNLKGKLVAWDCSPVQHSTTLKLLSAETGFQMYSGGSRSKSQEGSRGGSDATTCHDRGTDVVQRSANVRIRRRLTTGSSNRRRAYSRNCSWPKHMLKATTTTETKLAPASREWHSKRKATTTTPLNYDPYSFLCSNDSVELTIPVIHAPPSLQPPSTSQANNTSYTIEHITELETVRLHVRSVCAIIDVGGGGLPPAWTLLRKGPRQLRSRMRKRRGASHNQVDVLCTL